MAKFDKILQELEKSEMLGKLIDKVVARVACIWHKNSPEAKIEYRDREVTVEKFVDRPVEKKVVQEIVPAWAKPLAEYQPLVQYVTKHPSLASILLTDAQPQEQVLRFLVCGSQWSNILRVWDALAEQAKQTQQPINATEQQVLDACLALFNQTLSDCQAQLQCVEQGASYHYDHHQRANSRGERVQTVLLQGLLNAAEDVVRSAVVITQ